VSRTTRVAILAAAGAVGLWRRRSRRARVGLYFADGLLLALPPASPAALLLRAAAGEVLRAFSPAAALRSPDVAS
jgi:hypothetical protein